MWARRLWWLACIGLLVGCSFTFEGDPTQTPSPFPTIDIAALTPSATPTASLTPSESPSPTDAASPSPSPSPTDTPTPTPTHTPLPTSTPYPTHSFLNDQWEQIEVPANYTRSLERYWLAFSNFNDTNSRSAEAIGSDIQTLYLVQPASGQRLSIAEIPALAGDAIFWSPTGERVAYFTEEGFDEEGNPYGGLYIIDLKIGLHYRVTDMPNLNPRGIPGHQPDWSPDGRFLSFVMPTDYATDVFVLDAEAAQLTNITDSPAYDWWSSFSPDGLRLAFVSDRHSCPSRNPADENNCDAPDLPAPSEGRLYIYNMNTTELRQVTDIDVTSPPQWISPTRMSFTTGDADPLATRSSIWMVDTQAGTAGQLTAPNTLSFSPSWAASADRVLYQRATDSTDIVLADSFGTIIDVTSRYIFPRYGMVAAWSPDGSYLAIGGRGGQCPYGIIVTDPTVNPPLDPIREPAENLLACDPLYSPDSSYLAFAGVQPNRTSDGRLDIFVANANGLGARNITQSLRGQMNILGWVGGISPEAED